MAGDTSGDVHTICLSDTGRENAYYHAINNVPGPVHCISQSGSLLAVSSGNVVQLIKQGTIATWEVVARLPDPPKFPELEGELPEPMARSLHFLGVDDDVLLVTYLDHGIVAWNLKTLEINWRIRPRSCKIGCSAVSPNEKVLATTNLYDGIDWYSLDSNHFMDASFQHTTTHAISENVILPLTFVHNGTAVLSGTSTSCARLTSLKDHSLEELLQHDGDIIQALAYSSAGDYRQIVTVSVMRRIDRMMSVLSSILPVFITSKANSYRYMPGLYYLLAKITAFPHAGSGDAAFDFFKKVVTFYHIGLICSAIDYHYSIGEVRTLPSSTSTFSILPGLPLYSMAKFADPRNPVMVDFEHSTLTYTALSLSSFSI
ncbi:hypothetical protein BJY52DRAFT_1192685 [Lactarius psammicola]|nr:hypothetical protein BJY52DRAFT_1192685 [Lactarius psammicola]